MNILNGTTATIGIDVAPFVPTGVGVGGYVSGTTSSASGGSLKCKFGSLEVAFRSTVADEVVTFCAGRWSQPIPGRLTGELSLDGAISNGDAFSSPLALINPAGTDYHWFNATFDTGCSISGPVFFTLDSFRMQAFGQAPRQAQARVVGKPSIVWVIA